MSLSNSSNLTYAEEICEYQYEVGSERVAPEYVLPVRVIALLLLVIVMLFYVLTIAWWFVERRHDNMVYKRSSLFMLLCAIGCMWVTLVLYQRLYIGPGKYLCDVYVWRFLGIPAICGPVITRTLLFYARMRFNRLMVEIDDSQSMVLEQYKHLSMANAMRAFRDRMLDNIPGIHREVIDDDDGEKSSVNRMENRLLFLFFFTTNAYGVMIWTLTLIIAFIYISYLYTVNDSPLGYGCTGCGPMHNETAFLASVLLGMWAIGLLLLFHIRKEEDPLGIMSELRMVLWLYVPFVITSVLDTVDPGHTAKDGTFSWTLIMPLWFAAMHFVQCPMQLMKKYQRRVSVKAAPEKDTESGSRIPQTLEEVLAIPSGRHTFVRFLGKEWSVENMYFHDAVLRYQALDGNGVTRYEQALKVYRTFIPDTALFQVNISHTVRHKIEHQVAELEPGEAPEDLFDAANEEIFHLMKTDSFERFVKSPIFKEWINSASTRLPHVPVPLDTSQQAAALA